MFRVVDRAVAQRLDKAGNRRNRRFQLVRHVRHEIAAHVFKLLEPRDIVKHQQRAGRLIFRDAQQRAMRPQKLLVAGIQFNFRLNRRRAAQRRRDKTLHVNLANHLMRVAHERGVERKAKQPSGGLITANNARLGIKHNHRLDHAAQNRFKFVALLRNDFDAIMQLRRHAVQRVRDGANFPRAGHDNRFLQRAGREPARACRHRLQRPADAIRQPKADRADNQGDRDAARRNAPIHRAQDALNAAHARRRPNDGERPAMLLHRNRHVHHFRVQRVAVARRHADLPGQRLPDFRAVAVIIHARRQFPRIADDRSRRQNYGDAAAQRFAEALAEPINVSLRRRFPCVRRSGARRFLQNALKCAGVNFQLFPDFAEMFGLHFLRGVQRKRERGQRGQREIRRINLRNQGATRVHKVSFKR